MILYKLHITFARGLSLSIHYLDLRKRTSHNLIPPTTAPRLRRGGRERVRRMRSHCHKGKDNAPGFVDLGCRMTKMTTNLGYSCVDGDRTKSKTSTQPKKISSVLLMSFPRLRQSRPWKKVPDCLEAFSKEWRQAWNLRRKINFCVSFWYVRERGCTPSRNLCTSNTCLCHGFRLDWWTVKEGSHNKPKVIFGVCGWSRFTVRCGVFYSYYRGRLENNIVNQPRSFVGSMDEWVDLVLSALYLAELPSCLSRP